ncbi:MAG TPA: SDR family oxidoreductase [Gallionellaceae bacterium]|nr:SDR family oxidoreductase [Gallionellaceae bacterium]
MHVVITGASSGIGLALARHYLEAGAVVAAFARRAELLEQLSAQYPGRVHTSALDVRDAAALQQAAQAAIARFGPPDVVIANAGVSHGTVTDDAADEDVFRDIMDINVLGMVKTFQPFLAGMREARTGTLVGIASVAGFRGLPGSGAYSASKAAAIAYLEALRVELRGSGVRVVTICPGYIRTPMTASNRFHMPFLIDADDAARRMARVIEQRRSFVVIPWQMAIAGKVLSWLPNWVYDPLFSRVPRKRRRTA